MKKPTILFADNNQKFLEGRKEFLEKAGYRVIAAFNPVDARKKLEAGGIDLLIADIRMENDGNEEDRSGLDLVKSVAPEVPKIIMTGYPTWQAVREAYGADLNGIPPVVDFISKDEVSRMMIAVNWTLKHNGLKRNLFESFDAQNMMALQDKWISMEENEASSRLKKGLEQTTSDITKYREEANGRARQYHNWGIIAGVVSIGLILMATVLTLTENISTAIAPMITSMLSQAASNLLYGREEKAHQRVSVFFEQLEEVNQLLNLLSVCDTISNAEQRDHYKGLIISRLTDKWFVRN